VVTKLADKKIGSVERRNIVGRMNSQKANRDYLRRNYEDLLKKYRNHWVVISGGKLTLTEKNPDRLYDKLSNDKSEDTLVFYLADPEDFMLL
jgi:hypothetical protein